MPPTVNPAPVSAVLPRIVPFVTYMAFIALAEAATLLGVVLPPDWEGMVYPVKAACVAIALVVCLPKCDELRLADLTRHGHLLFSVLAGVAVFIGWLALDVPWGRMGTPVPFAKDAWGEAARPFLLGVRFIGAALLVPLAEELFWRSFLLRYLQGGDFRAVPLTRFHPLSFFAVVFLFGLEHQLVLAGFMAGAVYNFVLYRTGSVMHCVVAHAVTNALLGVWVLLTGAWTLW